MGNGVISVKKCFCVVLLAALCGMSAPAVAEENRPGEDGGESATLDELLEYAEKRAPKLRRARKRVGLGEAEIEEARRLSPYNPEVEGRAGLGVDGGELSEFEVSMRQRLEVAGQRGLRIDAAQREEEVYAAELAETRWEVLQKVRHLFRTGVLERRRVEIERESLEFAEELLEMADEQVEAGEEPRISAVVARAERAKARKALTEQRQSYRRTLRELEAVVGWRKDAPPRPGGQLEEVEKAPSEASLLESAREHDPKLAILDAQLEQARADRALAEREVWPDPTVGLGFEREGHATANPEDKLNVILGVPLPVFERNQGDLGAASARIGLYEQAVEDRRVVLESRVLEQLEAVESTREQVEIYEDEVMPALEEQLDLLQEGFELGEMSLLDVVDARDRLLEVQRQHLEALVHYYTAFGELEEVVGTDIDRTANQ